MRVRCIWILTVTVERYSKQALKTIFRNLLVKDANALYLSSQRALPLRCDFVNDDFSTSESTAQPFDEGSAHRFPVSPHAPHPAGASPPPPVFFASPLTRSGP